MFVTDGDLPRSLKLCDVFSDRGERETYYGGVFMENSSSSTNTDHPGKFIKADNPMYPCNILDKQYLSECYRYQSSYFAIYSKSDWAKVANLCSQVPNDYQLECFQTIGTNQVGYTQDFSQMKKNCGLIKEDNLRNICIQGIVVSLAGRYVNKSEKLIEFCQLVDAENKKSCFEQLGTAISAWYKYSVEAEKICDRINDENYASWCHASTPSI